MDDLLIVVCVLAWVGCGVLDYGLTAAYFQRTYTIIADECAASNRRYAAVTALFGPIALIATIIVLRPRRGWML